MPTDFRFALRALLRTPGFFVLAILTLALGIAGSSAIFSLFDQVLLRSLPVRDAGSLVVLHTGAPQLPGADSRDNDEAVFSYPMYRQLSAGVGSFQALIGRAGDPVQLRVGSAKETAAAEIVTGNLFDVLGVQPRLGRLLTPADDSKRGASAVVVLGYDFWMRRFGGSGDAVGRKIDINDVPCVIAGVAPESFRGVLAGHTPDVYAPLSLAPVILPRLKDIDRVSYRFLNLIARLAPGVSRDRAQAELQPLYTAVLRDHIQQFVRNEAARQRLTAQRIELRGASQGLNSLERQWRRPLTVLMVMVLVLLAIGCGNLANLLLARGVNRSREIAIRFALGAGRWRVVRLLVTESVIVALCGTVLGVAASGALTRAIIGTLPGGDMRGWLSAEVDGPVLLFGALAMMVAAVSFGLFPAIQATRGAGELNQRTQGATSGRAHSGTRKALLAGQVALSLVLLSAAGLFGRSLVNLIEHNVGFRAEHLLTFRIDAGLDGYNVARGLDLYRTIATKVAALPGVKAVSFSDEAPFSHSTTLSNVMVEGYAPRNMDEMNCERKSIAPGFFSTLRTPLIAGREFDERDAAGAPKVAVVNQTFVRRFIAGGGAAVGRKMSIGAGGPLDIEIVGVAADADNLSVRETELPTFYIPFAQPHDAQGRTRRADFFVRADRGFDALPGEVRAILAQVDASLPVRGIQPMETKILESVYIDRLLAGLASAFSFLALVLTAVGLYGVLAYVVSRRTAEIGIRMVLGANRRNILALIFGEVGAVVIGGGVIGLLCAAAAGRAIESELFGVRGPDPIVLAGAFAVLCGVAACAAGLPALRASRVEPAEALRHE